MLYFKRTYAETVGLYGVGVFYIVAVFYSSAFSPGFIFAAAGSTMGAQLLPLIYLFQLFHIHQKDVLSYRDVSSLTLG